MSAYREVQQDKVFGRFLLVSLVLHVVFIVLFPVWETNMVPGPGPGDGAIQLSLRRPEADVGAMVAAAQTVRPESNLPRPQPQPQPQEQVRVETPAAPDPPQPQPQPQPVEPVTQVTAPAPVQAVPTPVELPQNPRAPEPVALPQQVPVPRPQEMPVEKPAVDQPPVMTAETGTVAVAERDENSGAPTGEAGGTGTSEGQPGEAVAAAQPAPPPVPAPAPLPAVGSLLRLPGGQYIPKDLEADPSLQGAISIRVIVTVDENGEIVSSEIDPSTRSDIPLANQYALLYAEQRVRAQIGPEGQAYQAALTITFDPNAVNPAEGVRFTVDPDERIRLIGNE